MRRKTFAWQFHSGQQALKALMTKMYGPDLVRHKKTYVLYSIYEMESWGGSVQLLTWQGWRQQQ